MAWRHGSAESRGYGAAWRKLRVKILKRDNYVCQCSECRAGNLVTSASEVDHVLSKADWLKRFGSLDRVDDPTNLQAINKDCHIRKTALEMGARPRAGCDVNGWPQGADHPGNAT